RKVGSEEIKPGPVRTQGCGTIKIFQGNTFPGTVNTGLIPVNPRTQLPENIGLYLRDGAVGAGRNIEQQVAAVTDHIREDPDNLIGRLVGIIRRLISPAAVDGEAKLPMFSAGAIGRYALFRCSVITITGQPRSYNSIRVCFKNITAKSPRRPLCSAVCPVALTPPEVGI